MTDMEEKEQKKQKVDIKMIKQVILRIGKKLNIIFLLKVFAVFALCVSMSFAIAIFYVLNKLASDGNFEKIVNQKVSEAINMEVHFQKIEISFPSFELINIHIATDSADLKLDSYIDSVRVRPDFMSAISGKVVIDYMDISSSTTSLQMKAIKSTDKAKNPEKSEPADIDLSKIIFPFKSLSLSNIRFNYTDDGANCSYDFVLKNGELTYSLLSSALPYKFEAEWVNKATISATGDLYWPSKMLADVNLKILDMKEIKKLVPAEYQNYFKSVTASDLKAVLDYSIINNSLSVKEYLVNAEPLFSVSGNADLQKFSPLLLKLSANAESLKVSDIWPLVKDFIPSEYGVSLNGGNIGGSVDIALSDDKPMALSANIKPEKIEVKTSFLPEKIVLTKGQVYYDGEKVKLIDLEAGLSDSLIKINTFILKLKDLSLESDFGIKFGLNSLMKNLKAYFADQMNLLDISGDMNANGNIKGKLSDISSLTINGDISGKNFELIEKTTSAKGSINNFKVKILDLGKERGTIKVEDITASAIGASLSVNGVVKNQKHIGLDCKAVGNVNVGEFSKLASGLFGLEIKENQYKGNLGVDLKIDGTVDNLKPSGKIVAKDIYADVSKYGLVVEAFNGDLTASPNQLAFNGVKAKLLGGELEFKGSIRDFNKMKVDAVANVKGTDLSAVRKLIGAFVPEMDSEINFDGKADLNARLSGFTSAPSIKGSALLTNVSFRHPAVYRPIEKINGYITFDNRGLTSKMLTAYWGTSKAKVSGSMKDWARFISDFKFNVEPLDVTDSAGFFLKESGYEIIGMGIGSGTVTGALEKIKVDCTASVDVGTVTAVITKGGESLKFPFSNLKAKLAYFNNTLDVSSASLKLFAGDITAKAKVSIGSEPISFQADANIEQLLTQEFLKVNASPKYQKTLEGGLDGYASLKGEVTGLNTVNGTARLAMPSGRYDSPDIIKKVADKLKNPSLASGTIENVSGDYSIANGRISSNNTMGEYKDSKVVYKGSVGLDASLDGTLEFELGKETCESGYLKELIGDSETLNLTCRVKGSLTSPDVDIPLSDIAKKSAMNELNKILDKKGFDAKGADGSKEKAEKAIEKALDTLGKNLKKLFK